MKYLSTKEAAYRLNITVGTLRNWVSAKKIPYKKANGKLLFDSAEIDSWLSTSDTIKKDSMYEPYFAALIILNTLSNIPDEAIDKVNHTIDFPSIYTNKLTVVDKNKVDLAANLYEPEEHRIDFLSKIMTLDKKDTIIVLSALKQRLLRQE